MTTSGDRSSEQSADTATSGFDVTYFQGPFSSCVEAAEIVQIIFTMHRGMDGFDLAVCPVSSSLTGPVGRICLDGWPTRVGIKKTRFD